MASLQVFLLSRPAFRFGPKPVSRFTKLLQPSECRPNRISRSKHLVGALNVAVLRNPPDAGKLLVEVDPGRVQRSGELLVRESEGLCPTLKPVVRKQPLEVPLALLVIGMLDRVEECQLPRVTDLVRLLALLQVDGLPNLELVAVTEPEDVDVPHARIVDRPCDRHPRPGTCHPG